MSRITTYRNITSLSIHDLLLISDMGTIGNPTKTVTVGDLIDFGVGSGTPLYLPMWTSDGNLTDSNFYQTSTGNIRTNDATLLGFGKDSGRSNTRLHITTLKDGTSANPPGVALVVEELTPGVSKLNSNVLMAMTMDEGNGYFYVRNGDEKGKFTFYGWDGSSFDKYLTIENTGKLNMESHQITSVADPTGAQDAATKAYVDAQFTGNVDGSGTAGFIPKWSDTDTITDSIIQESGSNIGIGTAVPDAKLEVNKSVTTTVDSSATNYGIKNVLESDSSFKEGYIVASRATSKYKGSGNINGVYGFVPDAVYAGKGDLGYLLGSSTRARIDNTETKTINAGASTTLGSKAVSGSGFNGISMLDYYGDNLARVIQIDGYSYHIDTINSDTSLTLVEDANSTSTNQDIIIAPNINVVYGSSNDFRCYNSIPASISGWMYGTSTVIRAKNPNLFIDSLSVTSSELEATEGTFGNVALLTVNTFDTTITGNATFTGNYSYIYAPDTALPTVGGDTWFINSVVPAPSRLGGDLQVTGKGIFTGNIEAGGSVKVSGDTDAASASKVGTLRYRTTQSGSDYESLCEMCMQTGANTYAWVTIVSHTWQNM